MTVVPRFRSAMQKFTEEFRPFLPILEYLSPPVVKMGKSTNALAFYPAWTAVNGQSLVYSKNPAWRQQFYAFLKPSPLATDPSQCSLWGRLRIVLFLKTSFSWLHNGACTDSFSSAPGGFKQLVSQPFGALERGGGGSTDHTPPRHCFQTPPTQLQSNPNELNTHSLA